MLASLWPLAGADETEPIGIGSIFPTHIFYYTESFKELVNFKCKLFSKETGHIDRLNFIRRYYAVILEKCYSLKSELDFSKTIKIIHPDHQKISFFKIETNNQFIQVNATNQLPQLNRNWVNMLCGNEEDLNQLMKELPVALFTVEGFIIFCARDITDDEAMNQLKNLELHLRANKEDDSLIKLETILGILLGDITIKIGVVPFFKINNEIITETSYYQKTLLISTLKHYPNEKINRRAAAEMFTDTNKYILYPVVNSMTVDKDHILTKLEMLNIGSYMILPVRSSTGEVIGILELATERENGMSEKLFPRLEPAMNLIADILEYMIGQFEEQIRTIIKERFTPLQPAVDWKFNEAAWHFIRSRSTAESQLPNVVFEDVFPLYCAIDVFGRAAL